MDLKKSIVILVCFGACIFFAACCGGNAWFTTNVKSTGGLWKFCTVGKCDSYPDNLITNKLKMERGFSLVAVVLSIIAGLMALINLLSDNIYGGCLTSIVLILATISMIVALSIFLDDIEGSIRGIESLKKSYGWSFYVGWVGCGSSIFGAVIGFIPN